MLTTLAMLVLLSQNPVTPPAQPQAQTSLFREIIKNPTGRNGYEEYVQAAEMLRGPEVSLFTNWTPHQYETLLEQATPKVDSELEQEMTRPLQERLKLAKQLDGMTLLEVRREAVKRYGRALDLISRGNQKPVFDPRPELGPDVLFPELAYFRSVARFSSIAVYVALADGQPARAMGHISDMLTMGHKIGSRTLISYLVGISIQSMALAELERHADRFSLHDWRELQKAVEPLIADRQLLVSVLKGEMEFGIVSLRDLLYTDDELLEDQEITEAERRMHQQFKAMTPAQKEAYMARARKQLEEWNRPFAQMILGNEEEWGVQDEALSPYDDEDFEPKTLNEALDYFLHSLRPSPSFLSAAQRIRTQLRLAQLHSYVQSFKWQHDRLPTELSEAVPQELLRDPLSRQPFIYEPQSRGYRLVSAGSKVHGEIAMRYQRPRNSEPQEIPPGSQK